MNELDQKKWETVRNRGLLRFLLVNGLLYWGLPMLIITGILNNLFKDEILFKNLILHVVLWVFGGLLYGAFVWWIEEARYRRAVYGRGMVKRIRWWASPLLWAGIPVLLLIVWGFSR